MLIAMIPLRAAFSGILVGGLGGDKGSDEGGGGEGRSSGETRSLV